MSIASLSPVSSLDNNLLVLEAAAVLSLFKPENMAMLDYILGDGTQNDIGLEFLVQKSADEVNAGLGGDWIRAVGLELPSVANGNLCPNPMATLRECAKSIDVAVAQSKQPEPHLVLVFLNLHAVTGAWQQNRAIGLSFDTVWNAWRGIREFLRNLHSPDHAVNDGGEPNMVAPNLSRWNPHNQRSVGDYAPWTSGLGPMFQTLNGWDSAWSMPPKPRSEDVLESVAYWGSLPTLVLGILGWSDPALGLARWILSGMPTNTRELLLLRRNWGADSLMYFCHPQVDWNPTDGEINDFRSSGTVVASLYEASDRADEFNRCGGLHMSTHLGWQLLASGPGSGTLFGEVDQGECHAYFLRLETLAGWYAQLRTLGGELTQRHPGLSIELTLLAPSVGILGRFSQSQVTARWHSTTEEVHCLGNTGAVAEQDLPSSEGSRFSKLAIPTDGRPSRRYTNALVFWVASELARRHAGYGLYCNDNHPADSAALILRHDSKPTVFLPRHGRVVSEGWTEDSEFKVDELLAFESPRALIHAVERQLGLHSPQNALPSTRHTLMYRVMAAILSSTCNDKAEWNFAAGSIGWGQPGPWDDWMPHSRTTKSSSASGMPWTLLRNGEPRAVLTPDGIVHKQHTRQDLFEVFIRKGRRVTPTIGEVFGRILP